MSLPYEQYAGAIYDVDDTLLNNLPPDGDPFNLHERSRLAAIHGIARECGHAQLLSITAEENRTFFENAPHHTVDAAVWAALQSRGLAEGELDLSHDILTAIVERKAALHMDLLLASGVEVAGASSFVRSLECNGFSGRQAIASGARHDEIDAFLGKYGLAEIFPVARIIARGDYTNPKPDPESFDTAYRTLGLPDTAGMRASVLAFEDDPKGVVAALASGHTVGALTTRFEAEVFLDMPIKPHMIQRDFVEYADLLGLPL
ncbi:MAG TPA: HAD family phosphatase [Patescibacteria group bacterium]|nr:HAD family phosphatase [Patescibacteria group bacterium]